MEKKTPPKRLPQKPNQQNIQAPAKPKAEILKPKQATKTAVPVRQKPAPHKPQTTSINKNNNENILNQPAEQTITQQTENSNKKKKQTNKGSKKAKIIILICIIFVVCAACGVTATILINKQNNKKLQTPTLEIVSLFDSTILKASPIKRATSYEFEISYPGQEPFTILSKTAEYEIASYLNQPGEYFVRVRVNGKGKKATSEYSETKSILNTKKLAAPIIYVEGLTAILEDDQIVGYKTNENINDDIISWQQVKNATRYYIYYGVKYENGQATVLKKEITSSDQTIRYSLSNIYSEVGTGVYSISVSADAGSNIYYETSEASEQIKINYYAQQSSVKSATYCLSSNTLNFKIDQFSNIGNEYEIKIEYLNKTKTHIIQVDLSKAKLENNELLFEVDLTHVIDGDVLGMTIVKLSNGEYSTNSDPCLVTIQN